MWGARVLAHTEETRKMPFKPHWASLGHGHLICAWLVQPGTKWATYKERVTPYKAGVGTFPGVLAISLPWRGGNPRKHRDTQLAHTSRVETGASWGHFQ